MCQWALRLRQGLGLLSVLRLGPQLCGLLGCQCQWYWLATVLWLLQEP